MHVRVWKRWQVRKYLVSGINPTIRYLGISILIILSCISSSVLLYCLRRDRNGHYLRQGRLPPVGSLVLNEDI